MLKRVALVLLLVAAGLGAALAWWSATLPEGVYLVHHSLRPAASAASR